MFFSNEVGHVFEPFSWLHFLLFTIIITGALLICRFLYITSETNKSHKKRCRISAPIYLIVLKD